jgi:hypothetical protein
MTENTGNTETAEMNETESINNFQIRTRVAMASDFLLTGKLIPKKWEIPDFILHNDELLSNFLGNSYQYYSKLPENTQMEMISWYEHCGGRLIEMFGTTALEDWDGEKPIQINLSNFKYDAPEIYAEIVKAVVPQLYPTLKPERKKELLKKFVESPEKFQNEIIKITKRRRKTMNTVMKMHSYPDLNALCLFNCDQQYEN